MSKKILLIPVLLAVFAFTSYAQNLAWVKTISSPNFSDYVYPGTAILDANNNLISCGQFQGTIDFDPGAAVFNLTNTVPSNQTFIQKLDANGNFLWAVKINDSGFTSANVVKTDALGNIYLAGSFEYSVDFDPGPNTISVSPVGTRDAFILKLDPNGNFVWVKSYGSILQNTAIQSMVIDQNNEIILSGYFQGNVDFDDGPNVVNLNSTANFSDIFLLKLNTAGNFIFAKGLFASDYADSYGLTVDPSSNICVAGTYNGTLDLDPGLGVNTITSNNSDDVFIVKLSPLGIFDWGKSIGTPNFDNVNGLSCDQLGNVFFGAVFSDSIDVDPSMSSHYLYSNGSSDVMLVKLAPNGNFVWGKNLGGSDFETLNGITTDASNNVYCIGQFSNSADFGPNASTQNLISSGDYDMFIASLDPNGYFRMAEKIGGTMEDNSIEIFVNNLNQLVGYGYFRDTADFDPSLTVANVVSSSLSNAEVCQFKWNQCNPTSSTLSAYHCNSYTLNGQTYTSTGTYSQVIPNAAGCDSIITLSLTIGSTNTTINQVQCNGQPYTYNGQSYTTAGTYYQYFTNVAGCDSNTIINLSFGTPSSYSFSDVGCDVYFFGNQILFGPGVYTNIYTNTTGCDSVVTLNLTINYSVYNIVPITSCGPYVWNGQTYTTSGTYTNYFISALGCDSVVDLSLTINQPSFATITDTVCSQLVWNGQTYTSSGIYTGIFQNSLGCDSTVTLNLTVNQPNTNTTQVGYTITSAASAPSSYQWINCQGNTIINGATSQSYTASSNGNYAVIVTTDGCTDTSDCKPIVGIATEDISFSHEIDIYPNPVKDILQLSLANSFDDYEINIRSLTSQILYHEKNIQSHHLEIPVKDWAKGMYFISISQSNKHYHYKFIKN